MLYQAVIQFQQSMALVKNTWVVWCNILHPNHVFARLAKPTSHISMEDIERYVVLNFFWVVLNSLTNDALKQDGHIWGQCHIGLPQTPSPSSWGWKRKAEDSPWTPYWTTLPEAAKICQELLRCGCKKSCQKSANVPDETSDAPRYVFAQDSALKNMSEPIKTISVTPTALCIGKNIFDVPCAFT